MIRDSAPMVVEGGGIDYVSKAAGGATRVAAAMVNSSSFVAVGVVVPSKIST